MNVSCGSCRAVYHVDPALVPATGVIARCSACGAAIPLTHARPGHAADEDWFAEEQGLHRGGDWRRALEESDAAAAPDVEVGHRPIVPRRVADRGTTAPWFEPSPGPTVARVTSTRHPFPRVTPDERAQRLARALVSDLIAYHPGRREAAQASGTLRIAFREEIARAYAVYAAEVGREMAEGTSYFQEALNEMVAQGRALF